MRRRPASAAASTVTSGTATRVGVLDREPLYVCQHQMARGHWRIIKHGPRTAPGKADRKPWPIAEASPRAIVVALKAARAIGRGLYGVDIKESNGSIVVIEINDNPNLEYGSRTRSARTRSGNGCCTGSSSASTHEAP
jgi:glutathione synthase/RimK-type ligase-like ATP-grasp enzyme